MSNAQVQTKVETKTSPFSLPKITTENLNTKKIRKLKYASRQGVSGYNILVGILIIASILGAGYIGYTLARLESVSNITQNEGNDLIPVSDEEEVDQSQLWSRREFKINNNVVWSLELPNNFAQTSSEIVDGVISFFGEIDGEAYKLELAFPLFNNYLGGMPPTLSEWVSREKLFLPSVSGAAAQTSSFTLDNNLEAALIVGMNEITKDNGSSREFGQTKTAVLYIWKTTSRNPSKITLIPQGEYNEEAAKDIMERIAASLLF